MKFVKGFNRADVKKFIAGYNEAVKNDKVEFRFNSDVANVLVSYAFHLIQYMVDEKAVDGDFDDNKIFIIKEAT